MVYCEECLLFFFSIFRFQWNIWSSSPKPSFLSLMIFKSQLSASLIFLWWWSYYPHLRLHFSRAPNEQHIRSEVKGYHSWHWQRTPPQPSAYSPVLLMNSCCMCLLWLQQTPRVYVKHYHNLCMCVCVCVFARAHNSWWICQRLQSTCCLSPWWTSCSDVYRDLLFNSGAS